MYLADILINLKAREKRVEPKYMKQTQTDIDQRMRSILIDWLIDVHKKFKLKPETLYLTVHIIDSYLQVVSIDRNHLQLVGVTAMFMASKYEEIYAPEVKDFSYVTDYTYSIEQILQLEGKILQVT